MPYAWTSIGDLEVLEYYVKDQHTLKQTHIILKYVAEMEARVTKRLFPEMEVGLMKLMLFNWKLE